MFRYHLMTLIEKKSFDDGRRVTINDISDATGIHRATLSKMINSPGCNVTLDTIDRLCKFFQVPVEQIIEHIPDK
jgi:putative transcriptional regulator